MAAPVSGPPAEAREAGVRLVPDEWYRRLVTADILAAERRVWVATYIIRGHRAKRVGHAERMLRAIAFRASEGVDCRLLANGGGVTRDLANRNAEWVKRFSEYGVAGRVTRPGRTWHTKLVLIDDRLAYVGSHNFSDSSLGRAHETSVRVESVELVAALAAYFETAWKGSEG